MSKIKQIAAFSEDGIEQAIRRLDSKKQEELEKLTKELAEILGEKSKKRKDNVIISNETIFKEHILVQIRSKLNEYENLELNGKILEFKISFDFETTFNTMTIEQLKVTHAKLVEQEKALQNLDLIVKYHRGLLYLSFCTHANTQDYNTWIQEQLGVVYCTARRYMNMALLIKKYPRLLVCGLSFTQLQKHNRRLLDFLDKECEGLKEKLSLEVNIKTQDKTLDIIPSDDIYTPRDQLTTDPDFAFMDIATPEDKTEDLDGLLDWINEQCQENQLNDKLFPASEDMDIDEMLKDVVLEDGRNKKEKEENLIDFE